jgi:hypothetical protein
VSVSQVERRPLEIWTLYNVREDKFKDRLVCDLGEPNRLLVRITGNEPAVLYLLIARRQYQQLPTSPGARVILGDLRLVDRDRTVPFYLSNRTAPPGFLAVGGDK